MKKLSRVLLTVVALMMLLPVVVGAAAPYATYTYSSSSFTLNSPEAYVPDIVVDSEYMGLDVALDDPRDLFVAPDDCVYLVDAKNAGKTPQTLAKEERTLKLELIAKGDKVVTIGGITGVVVDVKENKIVLESGADQVRIEFEKWAISSNETASEAAKAEAKKAQEAKAKAKAAKKAGK